VLRVHDLGGIDKHVPLKDGDHVRSEHARETLGELGRRELMR
jgi:hypothetical protein